MICLLAKTGESTLILQWDRTKERGCDHSQLISVEEIKRKVDLRNGNGRTDDLDE